MSKEEPAWKAELRGTLEAITEMAFEKGPGLTEVGLGLVLEHIKAAEQRGREAGLLALGDAYEAHQCKNSGTPGLRLPCEHTSSVADFLRHFSLGSP